MEKGQPQIFAELTLADTKDSIAKAAVCGGDTMDETERAMSEDGWMECLQILYERFSHICKGADLGALSLIALWSLYLFLLHLYEIQGDKL